MSYFLSHVHAEIRRARLTRRGATQLPKDVKEGLHKEYPRMQSIALPQPAPLDMTLVQALNARDSLRSATPGNPLTLEECGTLLGHALQRRAGTKDRNYPSGGRLFPIETYLISLGIEEAGAGVFHYNPSSHALEKLWGLPSDFDPKKLVPLPRHLLFSTLIVFTSVWQRSSAKYGDLTYTHALLEAGHMSENILLTSAALGLNTCPMAGFDDQTVIRLLDIDEEEEQPVHSITVSKTNTPATLSDQEMDLI